MQKAADRRCLVCCLLPSAYCLSRYFLLLFRTRLRHRHRRDLLLPRCRVPPDRVRQLQARYHTPRRKRSRLYLCPYQHGHQHHTRDMFQSALLYLQQIKAAIPRDSKPNDGPARIFLIEPTIYPRLPVFAILFFRLFQPL